VVVIVGGFCGALGWMGFGEVSNVLGLNRGLFELKYVYITRVVLDFV